MIAGRPETLDALRARFPRALEHLFDIESVALGLAEPPGYRPDCIFDTLDGMRLIVSREDIGGTPERHVSASLRPGSPLEICFAREERRGVEAAAMGWFAATALARYRKISGDAAAFHHFEWSGRGVPHWRRGETPAAKHTP